MIYYEDSNGMLARVHFDDIQERTLYANSILAMTQYAIQRPKFMRFINSSVEDVEEFKRDFTFSAMLNSFPVVQQKEAAVALAFFMKCNLAEYTEFLKSNLGIAYSEYEHAKDDDNVMYFNEALPLKTNNIEGMYYAAFVFVLEFKTDGKLELVFENEDIPLLIAQYLLDEYNFYVGMSNGALNDIKAQRIIEKLPFGIKQKDIKADDALASKLSLFRLMISKLSMPAHNYSNVQLSDRSVSLINNLFDNYWQETEDENIEDYRLMKSMIAYITPLIEDFNYLQSKHIEENAPHEVIIRELEDNIKKLRKDLANMKEENSFLAKKAEKFSKANAKLPIMQQKIAWLEDENELLKERLKDNQPIIIKENELNDECINSFIEQLNTKRVGIVGGNEDWQDKVSKIIAVDVKITELNKIDSLKNCEVILINTGFISHTLYFATKNANKKAVFMYTDTLNTDVLKKDLYLNYRNKI